MSILKVSNLSKKYGAAPALDDVSFELTPGSITGLLGPNGAGKTTLIRIITGILQADKGEVLLKGVKTSGGIGYLPEERGLYKKMKVGEQIRYLANLKGLSKQEANAQWETWATRLEIKDWENRPLEDLSKGMQQKVQFVAALIHNPDLIILDEPFTGFDPVNADIMKKLILELRDQGKAIILATHRMETVEELCDQLVFLNNSKVILCQSKEQLFSQYRNLNFIVESDTVPEWPKEVNVLYSEHRNGRTFSSIKLEQGFSLNSLLKTILNQVELFNIQEEIPSMNDIFIQLVK